MNDTPSAMPSHAAVRSSCSALRNRSRARRGHRVTASTAKRRRSLSHASTTSSPIGASRSPSADRAPPRSSGTRGRPRRRSRPARATISCPGSSGSISTMIAAVVAQQLDHAVRAARPGRRRCRCCRRTAARVRQRRAPGTRSNTDRCSTLTPRARADVEEHVGDVDAEREDVRAAASATRCRPGPHPMSSAGPSAWSSARCSAALACREPAVGGQVEHRARRWCRGAPAPRRRSRRDTCRGELGGEARVRESRARRRRASANVSTSRSASRSATVSAEGAGAALAARRRSRRRHRDAVEQPGSGARTPIAQ